jgi:hypothetical protein
MSTREKLKLDIDTVPDDIVNVIEGIIIAFKKREVELDEYSLIQAIEDSRNGNVFGPFDTVEEAMASMLED